MIKQDYLVRMIQEIINMIVNTLLNKQKLRKHEWTEYDDITRQILGFSTDRLVNMPTQELIDRYEGDPFKTGKIELAATTMLKISDDMEEDDLLRKSKLHQDGLSLLKYVQQEDTDFSIQRAQLIEMLEQ